MDKAIRHGTFTLKFKLFDLIVIFSGLAFLVANLANGIDGSWKEVAVFALLAILSQLMPTRIPQGDIFPVGFLVELSLIVSFGMPVAVITGYTTLIFARFLALFLGRKESMYNILKSASQAAITIGLTSLVYAALKNIVVAFMLSSATYFVVYTLLLALNSKLSSGQSFRSEWIAVIRALVINYIVLSIMAYVMTVVYQSSGSDWRLFTVFLFFIPVMLVSHSFRLYTNIKQGYLNTVKTMVSAIEAKDNYTRGHSERVAELALALAKEMRLPDRDLQKLQYVALLHDTGKIGINEEILNKPGPLTNEEFEEIKNHSVLGAGILQKIRFLSSKADIILHHHEKFDGSGYPSGLKGEQIPLEARVLAVADAYDAMTTDRPFRRGRTPVEAMQEITRLAEAQFDPKLVHVFRVVLKRRGEI